MKFVFLLLTATLISACASTRREFKTNNLKPGEAVAIGRINILYNGQKKNKDCAVCLNSTNGPCQKLDEDGIVFISLPRGVARLRRIACMDVSGQHYNIEEANFPMQDGVNYFGDIEIEWKNKGGFKASTMFGAIGAAISESSNDGSIKMNVRDGEISSLIQEYENQTQQSKAKVNKNIVSVGR